MIDIPCALDVIQKKREGKKKKTRRWSNSNSIWRVILLAPLAFSSCYFHRDFTENSRVFFFVKNNFAALQALISWACLPKLLSTYIHQWKKSSRCWRIQSEIFEFERQQSFLDLEVYSVLNMDVAFTSMFVRISRIINIALQWRGCISSCVLLRNSWEKERMREWEQCHEGS